ncbi:hypothetical protein [Comamonas testosteroni]|jgi:hypothetical protein|uniref:hypothetical protein n=1 Tax=Comamonas testosteroni TaxID=285 RepID=UPI0026ED2E4F|nr:hypothetical protein [Comamonas testosteroni]
MFINYTDYVQAALQALAGKPKGVGYSNGTGVVFLMSGELCYVEAGESIDEATEGDRSAWDEATSISEFRSLRNPEFVQRFTPEDVAAHEQSAVELS